MALSPIEKQELIDTVEIDFRWAASTLFDLRWKPAYEDIHEQAYWEADADEAEYTAILEGKITKRQVIIRDVQDSQAPLALVNQMWQYKEHVRAGVIERSDQYDYVVAPMEDLIVENSIADFRRRFLDIEEIRSLVSTAGIQEYIDRVHVLERQQAAILAHTDADNVVTDVDESSLRDRRPNLSKIYNRR